jgi:predicted GNAT family acetyltransferase
MYRLGQLRHPTGVPGRARLAGSDDVGIVTEWLVAFQAEAQRQGQSQDAASIADRRTQAGEVTLWAQAEKPVSMAACSRPAHGVARVGPVYTPPAHRRHGFGAAVTAAATARALESGATYVVLYTDLANPTSNSVYQSIGYLADHDAVERRFSRR